jgi:phosphocarrier protein
MEITLTLQTEDGLHARPAGIFAKKAGEFKSNIEIHAKGQVKNAKSIMGIMSLGLEHGTEIKLVAIGEDESQALQALSTLVKK